MARGMNLQTDECVLCHKEVDSCMHLFFVCEYTKEVWRTVLLKTTGMQRMPQDWARETSWLKRRCKQKPEEQDTADSAAEHNLQCLA